MSSVLVHPPTRTPEPVRDVPETKYEYPGIPTTCDGAEAVVHVSQFRIVLALRGEALEPRRRIVRLVKIEEVNEYEEGTVRIGSEPPFSALRHLSGWTLQVECPLEPTAIEGAVVQVKALVEAEATRQKVSSNEDPADKR